MNEINNSIDDTDDVKTDINEMEGDELQEHLDHLTELRHSAFIKDNSKH
jgi:hypothetical protein